MTASRFALSLSAAALIGLYACSADAGLNVTVGTTNPADTASEHNAAFPSSPAAPVGTATNQGFEATGNIGGGVEGGVGFEQSQATMNTGNTYRTRTTSLKLKKPIGGGFGLNAALGRGTASGAGQTQRTTVVVFGMSIPIPNVPNVKLNLDRQTTHMDNGGQASLTKLTASFSGTKGP